MTITNGYLQLVTRLIPDPLKKHMEVAGLLVTKFTETRPLVTLGLLLINRMWKGGTTKIGRVTQLFS